MTTREFQVFRRRQNMVDILTPKRPGIQGYRFAATPAFDTSTSVLFTADISTGHLDSTIDRRLIAPISPLQAQTHVRIVFDPDNYTGDNIAEGSQFWLTFTPIDFSGAPGTTSALGLILPPDQYAATGRITVSGDVPVAADLANALQLDLPMQFQDFQITNSDGANPLFVATAPSGGEVQIPFGTTFDWVFGAVDTLYVRSTAGAVPASFSFTSYLPL